MSHDHDDGDAGLTGQVAAGFDGMPGSGLNTSPSPSLSTSTSTSASASASASASVRMRRLEPHFHAFALDRS
ncbi:hypothetical protein K8353_03735 [Burkholderia contaminans]|nr:hypothetical protein [Burkholderia contaminans]